MSHSKIRFVAAVSSFAIAATMIGSAPSLAETVPDVPVSVPTDAPTAVPSAVPSAIPTAAPTAIPTAVPTDVPTATPTTVPTASPSSAPSTVPAPNSLASNTSGAWVGPWATTAVPTQKVPTTIIAASAMNSSVPPTTPSDVAMVAKSQIALSPTEPKQVSVKSLATAGGLVQSKITTVPDENEVKAGITKAGTKIVISSDSSKLSASDYQVMAKKAPNLTKALFPIPMVGPNGERTKASMFRATFQAGEKIAIQGTVAGKALKKGASIVIEKAPVTPDGTIGRYIRTHTIKPDKFGKYAQNIPVRQGLEMLRHRLLVKKTTVKKSINWKALEARAEAILTADEQKALDALKAKLLANAKAELTKAEAKLLTKLKIALKKELRSYALGHVALTGTLMMTVNFNSMKGSRDITLDLVNWPMNGCDPSTTDECQVSSISVPFPEGATKTATFIAPTSLNGIGFSANGQHGEKYTVNWSLDPNGTTTCAKISPNPSDIAKAGTSWNFDLNTNVQMLGYLTGTPANDMWSSQWTKSQNKGKTPLGCGFKATQSFGTWWTGLDGWVKDIIYITGLVAVSIATAGIADAVGGIAVGSEVAADSLETMNAAIQFSIDAGEDTFTEADLYTEEGGDVVFKEAEDGTMKARKTLRRYLKDRILGTGRKVYDAYYAYLDALESDSTITDSIVDEYSDMGQFDADFDSFMMDDLDDVTNEAISEAGNIAEGELEETISEISGDILYDAESELSMLMELGFSDAEDFASNKIGTIVVN